MYDCQVAILPDTKDVRAVTPDLNAKGYGIYWHANPVSGAEKAKGGKDHITHVRLAHADIDPPKDGSAWDKDAVLVKLIEQGVSVVVDSGNGLQGVWFVTPGATVEQIEGVNRGILQFFGADKGTHNADRLLRMPGTINWPNAAKKARGLVPVPAAEVHRSDLTYDVGTLAAHFPYVAPPEKTGPDEIEVIPYEIIPLPERASVELQELVYHPPGVDRSVDVSKCVTLMAREGFTDAEILGVILNPLLPISAHCLDQGNSERAARRKCSLAAAHRPPSAEMMFGDAFEVELPPGVHTEPVMQVKARKAGFMPRDGGLMMPDDQIDHFSGCVYISSLDKVFVPGGDLLSRSRFDSIYGGHSFMVDQDTQKPGIKSAWDAFTMNQRFAAPTANYLCFRPEEPEGSMIEDGTRVAYNTYVAINTPREEGDVTPFLEHLKKLFPVDRDRRILLTFIASMLQNPGKKFQWAPVIVGGEGNGKTLLIQIIIRCIGEQYCYLPDTAKMTRNGIAFNGWIQGRLFLGMEEIYSANRRDFLEEFKPYVTNERLPIEMKGQDAFMGDNRANMVFITNHEDGIPFSTDMRRYCPLFTAQKVKGDKYRDGMGGDYFPKLWSWLRSGGFAKINHYLREYQCEAEFDPATNAVDAPDTSSTARAVAAGRGRAEQEVQEAIDQSQQGFAGGWVSSVMLDRLLDTRRISIPRNKRNDMMRSLGYSYHPALQDGRVNNLVLPDNGKPRLYVKDGHLSLNVSKPSEVARLYTEAQIRADQSDREDKFAEGA